MTGNPIDTLLDKLYLHDSRAFEVCIAEVLPVNESAQSAFRKAANDFINETNFPISELKIAELACLYENPSRKLLP